MDVVDFAFPMFGGLIPVDHGYALFSAVAAIVPNLHPAKRKTDEMTETVAREWEQIGVHPVGGRLAGKRQLQLTRNSQLVLRIPTARIPDLLVLAGRELDLAGNRVRLGAPSIRMLTPAERLYSRLVTIKGHTDEVSFLETAQRFLVERQIDGVARLVKQKMPMPAEMATAPLTVGVCGAGGEQPPPNETPQSTFIRRTIRIRKNEIVGFALHVENLSAESSIKLQIGGLGGRRRMGCGMFVPARAEAGVGDD